MAPQPEGKYFVARSRLSGLLLTVSSSEPGAPLVLAPLSGVGTDPAQTFYEDPSSGTIRTRLNDYCLDCQDGKMCVTPYQPCNNSQEWMLAGDRIQNRLNPAWVVDIAGWSPEPGAGTVAYDWHGGDSQRWGIEHTAPQYFYLKSMLTSKVVDVKGGESKEGARLISYTRWSPATANQLWYEDKKGVVRSKLNQCSLSGADGVQLRTAEYDPMNPSHQWVVSGNRISLRDNPNIVMDLKGGSSSNNTPVIQYEYNGGHNQHWVLDYAT